jgi:hypothetical protein
MKRHIFLKALTFGLLGGAFMLGGCETVENRISEHQDIYQSLPQRDQALVTQGQIRSGMSMQAVWLAWGSPEQKAEGEMRGRRAETWIYTQTTTYGHGYYGGYPYGYAPGPYGYGGFGLVSATHHHGGRSFIFFGDPFYDPFFYPSYIPPTITLPYKTVTFVSGRVASFQYLRR